MEKNMKNIYIDRQIDMQTHTHTHTHTHTRTPRFGEKTEILEKGEKTEF